MTEEEINTIKRVFEIIERTKDEVGQLMVETTGEKDIFLKMDNFFPKMVDLMKDYVRKDF